MFPPVVAMDMVQKLALTVVFINAEDQEQSLRVTLAICGGPWERQREQCVNFFHPGHSGHLDCAAILS